MTTTSTKDSMAYQRIPEEGNDDLSSPQFKSTKYEAALKILPWILFAITTTAYLLSWYQHWRHPSSPCFDETLLNAPIVWQESLALIQNLPETYLSNIDGDAYDIYSMHNPDVEGAWEAVRYEHITAISAEEMAHLPGRRKTAELYGQEEGYAVLLEVFHQIHCLDSIRKGYFGNATHGPIRGFEDPRDHADHCFSYLLQMILCHADVGVMTTRWIESHQDFAANFNVTRQCRNFDVIRQWSEGRKAKYDTPGQIAVQKEGHM
ncbi:hypothetical protein PISL3812_07566 [Talaromyces islandicus]|uniref:Cyclochlorotine biosynthesis protein O n=1 Tax=Talaromyces islandicus TaxID=28573 RepID=A0A0U1M558_TALIS|nr:hypothetical protein PISL3812_07566 [Talaromyces islandicus]